MNDFQGLLSGDYGFKPQGKSAPMAPPRSNPSTSNSAFDFDRDDRTNLFPRSRSSATSRNYNEFDNDVFGGSSRLSSLPVFDKPVYDDEHEAFGDILGGLGRKEPESKGLGGSGRNNGKDIPGFDDLLPGFGASTSPSNRNPLDSRWDNQPTGRGAEKATTDVEDPFVALKSSSSGGPSTRALYDNPLEQSSTFADSNRNKSENVFSSGGLFDDTNPFGGSRSKKSENISASGGLFDDVHPLVGLGNSAPMNDREKAGSPDRSGTKVSSGQTSASSEARDRSAPNIVSSSYVNASDNITSQRHTSTAYDNNLDSSDDVWLTVSEIPLFTQPTVAPPPSRPPPPKPPRISKAGGKTSFASPADGHSGVLSGDGMERHSDAAASAAAMKEAMDMAEARFKHAKEARERGTAKSARMQQQVREDKKIFDFQEREFRERQEAEHHLREEEERKQREEEDRMRREMEEKERKQRRIERERVERERVRQAVERATREARDRAAAEALIRAEKAVVGKAQAEARERAVRAAVFKAQEEARQRAARAAVEAKQRADREKAEREAREKSEREAKEKEARDKAAAAAASANQQRNENDLESFFGMGSHASNAPRPGASSSVRTSVGSTASVRKTSSSTNIVEDLGSIFGGAPSAGEFREFEGETEERRNARLQRHQRTQERAAKALAEKNQRDLEAQNEQAERHRIGETLDVEIKRWSAGKEGNLRALLSTLQYVLWPECGWQPVSLTDLITGVSVKKVYRKATLCIHPDKVQQKGATLQQKYVAEKVFDLLKEAWNKFNSEELF